MFATIVSTLSRGKAGTGRLLGLALLLGSVVAAFPAAAFTDAEIKATRSVLADIDHGQWADARQVAQRAHFPLLAKLVDWLDFTRPGTAADFGALTRFIDQNQDWPMQSTLKRHAEDAIGDNAPAGPVVTWFQRFPPIGPNGASRYIDALTATGQRGQAEATARQYLVDGAMTPGQVAQFGNRYSN